MGVATLALARNGLCAAASRPLQGVTVEGRCGERLSLIKFSSQAFVSGHVGFYGSSGNSASPVIIRCQKLGRCHASSHISNAGAKDDNIGAASVDRRQLLISSTIGIAGLPLILPPEQEALALPVPFPEITDCTPPFDPGNGVPTVNCCILPSKSPVVDFKFPTALPMRVRRPAHQATSLYIEKYNEAYRLMRELPEDDPRSFKRQAFLHCASCSVVYTYTHEESEHEYQVHGSWLFFPWHRWYLYFHERILASLIKDDNFALPFWNWDSAAGSTMPDMYVHSTLPALYDSNRNPDHVPPAIVNIASLGSSVENQLEINKAAMHSAMVTGPTTPALFFGGPFRAGDDPPKDAGTVENAPHNAVHAWTGSPRNGVINPNGEDMGKFYSAGLDPIFYAHHSNVDRLWGVWKTLGGTRRQEPTDPDWLNASFLFYDENSHLVRVKVEQCIDASKLFFKYEEVENEWATEQQLQFSASASSSSSRAGGKAMKKSSFKGFKDIANKSLDSSNTNLTVLVKRPKKLKADDYEEEVLLIEGLEVPANFELKFNVYINLPEATQKTEITVKEFAGALFHIPHGKHSMTSNFRVAIGGVLKRLGLEDADSFLLTIVPFLNPNDPPIRVKDVKLEYQ